MAQATGRASSKVILCGEHFVVYQCPAIAIPFNTISMEITLSEEKREVDRHSLVEYSLKICKKFLGGPGNNLRVQVNSKIPLASGMGSSAALSVAIVRAYSILTGRELKSQETFELSMEIEKKAHGQPSGIDSTVVTYEKPVSFTKGSPPDFLQTSQNIGMIILLSTLPSNTKQMVDGVRQFKEKNTVKFGEISRQYMEVFEKIKVSFTKGQALLLGELCTKNHYLLKEIGVFSHDTDRLVVEAIACGATGAKMSGGGGGGIVLAITEKDRISSVMDKLHEKGIQPLGSIVI